VHDALSPFAINSALWSVAVEFHIYLLFPLLVVSWRRLGPAVTTAWAALASAALYAFLLGSPYRVITPHYLLLFVLGMAAAAIYASPRWAELARLPWGIAPAILIPFAMAFHHFGPPRLVDRFLGVEDTVVGVGTAALLLAAARPGPVAQALSVGPLVRIGGFSYSVYLAHIPLLELIAHATGWNFQATGGLLKVAQMAMLVALATAGSYAFYLAFERPVVRLLSARRPAPAPT
jgi:peptidoglycan/LPS O-acetylase OafA/YrhL